MEDDGEVVRASAVVSDGNGTAEGGLRGRTPMEDADGRRESSRREPMPPPPAAAAAADTSPSAVSSSHHSGDENLPPPPASPELRLGKVPVESVPIRALAEEDVGGGEDKPLERPPTKQGWVDEVDEVDEGLTDEGLTEEDEDDPEGGTPDDVFLTAAVASVPPPSVAATKKATSSEPETATTAVSPPTTTVASVGAARPGSPSFSRSNFVSKLPAPPPLSARNPKGKGAQNPKGGTRANQNSRLASTFGRDAPAASARAGARVRSTTSAGYRAPDPRGGAGGVNSGLPSAERGADAKTTKKATYRDRIASGRRAATATATERPAAATEQPAAAPLGTPLHPSSEPDDGPVPSETPAKLRRPSDAGDEPQERVLTKAEEAKNRLRRNRRSSQSAVGPAGGFTGPRSSDGGGAGSAAAVSASVPSHPTTAAAAAAESARPAQKVGLSAAELADRLGSVKRVIKPRSSMPDLGRSRRAETTDGGPKKVDSCAAAADVATSSTLEGGVPVVRGLDEAELVLRVDTLANEDALNAARSAVTRMTELLEYVDATSRRLGCEPQNVFGHLLFRCGQPTDPTSRQLRLNDAVDPDRLRRMVAVTAELRGLLRIKVQDNNDLQLAATALRETAGFFARVDAAAAACLTEPWRVLAAQRPGGRARGGR